LSNEFGALLSWVGVRTWISGKVCLKQNSSTTLQKGNADATDEGQMGLGFSSCAAPLIWNAPFISEGGEWSRQ